MQGRYKVRTFQKNQSPPPPKYRYRNCARAVVSAHVVQRLMSRGKGLLSSVSRYYTHRRSTALARETQLFVRKPIRNANALNLQSTNTMF